MFVRECPHCFTTFTTTHADKVYCSVRCRSDAANERQRAARRHMAALKDKPIDDAWNDGRLPSSVTENALRDDWTLCFSSDGDVGLPEKGGPAHDE